jgi:hypothetical protein
VTGESRREAVVATPGYIVALRLGDIERNHEESHINRYPHGGTNRKPFHDIRFEIFTMGIMKNAVFWDIKSSSYFTGDTLRLRYRVQGVNII